MNRFNSFDILFGKQNRMEDAKSRTRSYKKHGQKSTHFPFGDIREIWNDSCATILSIWCSTYRIHIFESFKPIAKSFHRFPMWNLEILACSLRQTVLWIFQGEFTLFISYQTLKTFRILEHLARCPDKWYYINGITNSILFDNFVKILIEDGKNRPLL